ncbi:hypothetical protein EYF80_050531 [Xyrichtys novacula]|uniref:Uncharacterized protein n=1 Tax=Xyrichtys novacula TaxID=13765 RepID=A0AAV1EIV2_XYRNO|nr:hypothetical protein EYF80_050531 [Xyrichtys novacula]
MKQGKRRGTWLLEGDQWLSFNLGALHVGKAEGPQPPLLRLHTKSQRGSEPPLAPLTHTDSTRRLRDKEGSVMFMSTEPCESLLMLLLFLRGPQKGWRTFGCGAKNNKRGGSCVDEEADRPTNQRWLAKKGK